MSVSLSRVTDVTRTGKLELRYSMPKRFGLDANRDGLVDYMTTTAQVSPRRWTALIEVRRKGGRACDPTATYEWTIDGRRPALDFEPVGTCVFRFEHFPRLGTYDVGVTATKDSVKETGSVAVALKDWLIFGLGDSNGSGEGNPDVPGIRNPRWQDRRCDRSARSFQAVAARLIEDADPRSSVTFVHLVCSGASISQGLIGPYRGINDPGSPPIESQLSALQRLKGKREIDAVLVSVGVNDLGFGPLVVFCLDVTFCPDQRFPDAASAKTLEEVIQERLASLPGRYASLAARFQRLRLPASRIFISQYFDSTRDSAGNFCNPLIQAGTKLFAQGEAEWAFEGVLAPLNAAVAAAAKAHGWRLVTGAQKLFRPHGYCSDRPRIVGLLESLKNQGDSNGTLHANAAGHQAVANLVVAALRRAGIPK